MESDDSDDDNYIPIRIGAWGDQSQQQQQQQQRQRNDTNGHEDDTAAAPPPDHTKLDKNGWAQMINPESKKMDGAIGSGGLHRQGKNYKPISEENIIKQRKGVVIPKANKDPKTRDPRFGNKQSTPASSTGHRNFSRNSKPTKPSNTFSKSKSYQQSTATTTTTTTTITTTTQQRPPRPPRPPPPSTIRRPPPPSASGQSGWGAQPLVETPFWEKANKAQPPSHPAASKATPQQTQPNNSNNNWSTSWASDAATVAGANTTTTTTKRPSVSGFDNHQPTSATTTTTMSPPPGFGPTPQRQYPVKSNNKSQPPPPPGFSYTEKPAWGTPTSTQPESSSQLHSWTSNNDDKELWKRMDEGTRSSRDEQSTNNDNNNKSNGVSNSKKKNLDWVSGWDDVSLNQKPPPPPSQDIFGGSSGWGVTSSSTTSNGNWGAPPPPQPSPPSDSNRGSATTGMTSPPAPDDDDDDDTAAQQSPMKFLDQQMEGFGRGGRFSDPYKSKYSSSSDQDQAKHLPKNYYTYNGTSRPAFMEAPVKVASPPPSHNPVVILIHLELESGSKVPISIRKLDRPDDMARAFCQSQHISNPALISGITDLFAQQKSTAMQRYNRS